MGIKVGESGKAFRLGVGFDMSSNTALSLVFTSPSGTQTTKTNPDVTAPASYVLDPDVGGLNASEYFEYTIESTDFTEAGTWTVYGIYTNATPSPDHIYHSNDVTFTVTENA